MFRFALVRAWAQARSMTLTPGKAAAAMSSLTAAGWYRNLDAPSPALEAETWYELAVKSARRLNQEQTFACLRSHAAHVLHEPAEVCPLAPGSGQSKAWGRIIEVSAAVDADFALVLMVSLSFSVARRTSTGTVDCCLGARVLDS